MVNENAGELAANGFGNELRCNGAVYTAGESEQHFSVANLGADVFDGFLGVICHGPVGVAVANFHEEIFEHGGAVVGVVDFRMILHGVELLFHVYHGCDRAICGMSDGGEAFRHFCHIVNMAHPDDALRWQIFEKRCAGVELGFGLTEFALVGSFNLAAKGVRHELHAVAEAEHWNAELKNATLDLWRAVAVDAVWAAGKDDAFWLFFFDGCEGFVKWHDLAVNNALAHAARNELVVLAAEIDDDDHFLFIFQVILPPHFLLWYKYPRAHGICYRNPGHSR